MRIAFALNWKSALGLLAFAGAGALAVGWSGLVSISASSGHYSPVEWFLHWTMRNAVATQSALIEVPEGVDLADAALVQRAAGHFATGCAPCHGAPGVNQSPVVLAMMPPPPRLEQKVGEWEDRELFWIGQHGVKYSGMPAWTTQERPDEVWAMVAFLRALPGLSAEDYAALALGGADARTPPPVGTASRALGGLAETALADCARCHGRDGRGTSARTALDDTAGAFPVIAGQPEAYLFETLKAYAAGTRHSGYMQPPAARYDETVLAELAAHYAAQPAPEAAAGDPASVPETGTASAIGEAGSGSAEARPSDPAVSASRDALARIVPASAAYGPPYDAAGLLDLGRTMATVGLPERKLPACDSCHGGKARAGDDSKSANYPHLAGQPAWYLSTHLKLWREGHRGGGPYAHLMDKIAIHLTDQQIDAVSAWYAAQPAR